jgi:hypothetical protein
MSSKEQRLAELYNQKQRPMPKPQTMPQQAQHAQQARELKPSPPTIINNYYYVQPSPNSPPVQNGFVDPRILQQQQQLQQQQFLQKQQRHIIPVDVQKQPHPQNIPQNLQNPSYSQQQQTMRHSSSSSLSSTSHARPISRVHDDHDMRSSSRSATSLDDSTSSHNRSSRSNCTNMELSTDDDAKYESFVKRSSSNHRSPKRDSPTRLKDSYERDSIYASASLTNEELNFQKAATASSTRRNRVSSSNNGESAAKIPVIKFDGDILDDFNSLSIHSKNQKNLIKELTRMDDTDITVHNEQFYQIFQDLCVSGDSLTLEQLGSTLYDPHNSNNRFTFSSLEMIVHTFAPKSTTYELDFRSFVKVCKFVKGCFISFNYHDTRGHDHLLDFDEFQKALSSNRIFCPDHLLAQIFETSESIDFEHYIIAVIMIRKNEKSH